MSDKYVGFVPDSHFEKCVRHVCDAYESITKSFEPESLQEHGIDPIKMTFDMVNGKLDFGSWLGKEKSRQDDKTVNNTIGEFHQMLLGGVEGWVDLGVGDDSHLDLQKKDDMVFMELKNKENTVNSDSKKQVRKKLEDAFDGNPKANCYWAYIVAENGRSEDKKWWPYTHAKNENENIRRISGSKVYELVTGDGNNLERVWRVLPDAINNIRKTDFKISESDQKEFEAWFTKAFFK